MKESRRQFLKTMIGGNLGGMAAFVGTHIPVEAEKQPVVVRPTDRGLRQVIVFDTEPAAERKKAALLSAGAIGVAGGATLATPSGSRRNFVLKGVKAAGVGLATVATTGFSSLYRQFLRERRELFALKEDLRKAGYGVTYVKGNQKELLQQLERAARKRKSGAQTIVILNSRGRPVPQDEWELHTNEGWLSTAEVVKRVRRIPGHTLVLSPGCHVGAKYFTHSAENSGGIVTLLQANPGDAESASDFVSPFYSLIRQGLQAEDVPKATEEAAIRSLPSFWSRLAAHVFGANIWVHRVGGHVQRFQI